MILFWFCKCPSAVIWLTQSTFKGPSCSKICHDFIRTWLHKEWKLLKRNMAPIKTRLTPRMHCPPISANFCGESTESYVLGHIFPSHLGPPRNSIPHLLSTLGRTGGTISDILLEPKFCDRRRRRVRLKSVGTDAAAKQRNLRRKNLSGATFQSRE